MEEQTTSIPSKLREPGGRHDEIRQRINVFKESAIKKGLKPPSEFENDEHYWFTVMKRYHTVINILKPVIPDSDQRKDISLKLVMDEANELLIREQSGLADGLTKAWSRRALDNHLENLRLEPRKGSITGFLLVDIDHFGEYNNTHGHTAGDQMLIELVKTVKEQIRGKDMIGRYGGEEFGIILTELPSLEIVSQKAEDIRKVVADKLRITISIGATSIKPEDATIKDIYDRADKYLYLSKEGGRNQTTDDNRLVSQIK